jgi:hypothetical protein
MRVFLKIYVKRGAKNEEKRLKMVDLLQNGEIFTVEL